MFNIVNSSQYIWGHTKIYDKMSLLAKIADIESEVRYSYTAG